MSDKDKGNLLAILDSSSKIRKFVEDHDSADSFHEDIETFDAVLLNFVIIIESAHCNSHNFREATQLKSSALAMQSKLGFGKALCGDF